MTAPCLEAECKSDQQIAADFLSYLQSEVEDPVAYEVEPTRLTEASMLGCIATSLLIRSHGSSALSVLSAKRRGFYITSLCIRP